MGKHSLRQKAGCLVLDLPRLLPAMTVGRRWIEARNRHEPIQVADGGVDTSPLGPWSVDLHPAHVFPWVGRRLMQQGFGQWPIVFSHAHDDMAGSPQVTFVIPHRGRERLAQLRVTVASILGQEGADVECVVVEQSPKPVVDGLPSCVRVLHLPHPSDPVGWRKSWAFNEGVKNARADIVVCHDGDIPIPQAYAREVIHYLVSDCYEVCHLQRFLFCLSRADSTRLADGACLPEAVTPERVRQNWRGGTVAIRKNAFWRIGGFDESFVDWGGEDCEFYDRCQQLRVFRQGFLPFVHLWHPPQESKTNVVRERNLEHMSRLLAIPAADRIETLLERDKGAQDGPDSATSPLHSTTSCRIFGS